MESYALRFVFQTEKVCFFTYAGNENWMVRNQQNIILPKSQIEVDGVQCEADFENLVPGEDVDVYVPDWLAANKDLI